MFSISNMKISVRLGVVFGVISLTLIGVATLGAVNATHAISFSRSMSQENRETIALSNAQSAVWALRWGVAQFIAVTDANDRKQIVDSQESIRKQFDDSMRFYQSGTHTGEEIAVLKDLNGAFDKYIRARSKWFELYGSGKMDEAAKFRAEHLTPAGGATVKNLSNLIELQKKFAEANESNANSSITRERMVLVVVGALALLVSAVLAWIFVRSITRPLKQALAVAQRVAAGDLSGTVEARSMDETGELLQALKDMNESLVRIVGEVRSSAEAIGGGTKQIASGNADLSQRTEEQASSLEETASSMEELTSTVKQNAENARQANQLAIGASEVAVKGGSVVSQVVETMSSINESSKKIVDIIGVIDGIAFQTNILALNAAVEAARAGEQGRGFAVVASEVRNLAQRSAAAAKEIKALIGDSVDKVGAGTKLVDEAGKTMEEIVASVKRVTDIMGEITAASQEQSAGIEQVNQAITQMDEVTQQNAALVEEAAAAAESLEEQARTLETAVAVFKVGRSGTEGASIRSAQVVQLASTKAAAAPRARTMSLVSTGKVDSERARPPAQVSRSKVAAGGGESWEEF
ncbi:MAG: MCP four helix bundle domain-containing protein [Betaproteobacteria bacterium]|nr:MCP four helix bundle domain-containing protein [Betaproteobacteria bacterium]